MYETLKRGKPLRYRRASKWQSTRTKWGWAATDPLPTRTTDFLGKLSFRHPESTCRPDYPICEIVKCSVEHTD